MEQSQILWVSRAYTMPQAGVKPHSHPYYHMFYIVSGQSRFQVGGTSYDLQAGQCLLVPREMQHSYYNEENDPQERLEIKFTLPRDAMDDQLLRSGPLVSDDKLVGMLFAQILDEYTDLGHLADDAAAAYLMALLSALLRGERYKKDRQFRYVDASAYSELSQKIIRYLEDHFAEGISLDTIAEAMGYNKSYLCVAFKKNTRFTILDCLNMIRIRRAAELIVYSDHSLSQVAEMCGFASDSHFNRVFLKYVGTTPGQCRRAYPVDVLFEPSATFVERPNRFMYSVLAQKRITPEMIRQLDALEKGDTSEENN